MRTDPTDNGGLFLGRRPGTAPTRFRNQLQRGGPTRRRVITLLVLLMGALQTMHDIDQRWIILRRAAGHDQRTGALDRIFTVTAVIGAATFAFWFLVIHGPGSTQFSGVQVVGKTFPR
ncbi:MAG: hypothetical protein ACHQE6_02695 [Solirubrobacterales bacterium]